MTYISLRALNLVNKVNLSKGCLDISLFKHQIRMIILSWLLLYILLITLSTVSRWWRVLLYVTLWKIIFENLFRIILILYTATVTIICSASINDYCSFHCRLRGNDSTKRVICLMMYNNLEFSITFISHVIIYLFLIPFVFLSSYAVWWPII